jgi:hypothetical protein
LSCGKTAWLYHTPTELDRFPQELAETWIPSHVPAVSSGDWQVLKDPDRTLGVLGTHRCDADSQGIETSKASHSLLGQFTSRNGAFSEPCLWAVRLGKTGVGGRFNS